MKIGDYSIIEKLFQGKKSAIYRAAKENDTSTYILKLVDKKADHSLTQIDSIKYEYQIINQISSKYVIKAVEQIGYKDYNVIVLEDINGIDIKSYIIDHLFSFESFMKLAIAIATGLSVIHEKNIIHKDINPSNIIWNLETESLKIIDFNISSKFNIKISYLGNPERLQGTLAYISPEQTGRMNRSIDHRSDLYSLGITFYEMLTGQLPFNQNKPIELIYSHMVRKPDPPHLMNDKIPEILSDIVMKLITKAPEDRYQSATGLLYDLKKLQNSVLKTFELGEKDFSGKLQIPEKLYGRDREINSLLNVYQRVSQGCEEIVLVAGYSGTGKTVLVNEIHKSITKDKGYFISGKFDQLQQMIPYYTFAQAFNQFCELLLTENQKTLSLWKERILKAVGKLGKVLTDLIPQLESIIGSQPDIPKAIGDDSIKRFHYVFQCFVRSIATKEHPLIMFIDDLQWADFASLRLLKILIEDKLNPYFLFVGAYRDNEVSSSHPLMSILEETKNQNIAINHIAIKNLSLDNVQELCQDTLNISLNDKQELSSLTDLIYEKTQGNAFFTTQFLKRLYEENLLNYDFSLSRWLWDIDDIKKQNITDNVVDLLIHKMQTLPMQVQNILKLSACIGNIFDLEILSVISEQSKDKISNYLESAIRENMVYYLGQEKYKFVHDRIHQAGYSLIAEKDIQQLHLKIGKLLQKKFEHTAGVEDSNNMDHYIFDIVNHFNIGIPLIREEKKKKELLLLNLKASQNARRSAAYNIAASYVKISISLLPDNCWQKEYDITLILYNEAIKNSFLSINHDEMENYVVEVINYAHNYMDSSLAYEHRLMVLQIQNKPQKVIDELFKIWDLLGIQITESPEILAETWNKVKLLLDEKASDALVDLPMITDPKIVLAMKLFNVGVTAFIFAQQDKYPFVISEIIRIILERGLTPETPYFISLYSIMRVYMGDIPNAYLLAECAMTLFNKRNFDDGVIQVRSSFIYYLYMYGNKYHFKELYEKIMELYQIALSVGDFEYAGYFVGNGVILSRFSTELEVVNEKVQDYYDQAIQIKQEISYISFEMEKAFCSNLLDKNSNPAYLDVDKELLIQATPHKDTQKYFLWQFCNKQIILALLFEDYDNILVHLKEAEKWYKSIYTYVTYHKSDFCFYSSLGYLQLCDRSETQKNKEEYINKANETIAIIKDWADFGPVNYLHKFYLVQAELYRVNANYAKAEEFYDKAIEKAYENDYVNEAAIANELAAKCYMRQDKQKLASLYFIEARNCYKKWGAKAKVKHLDENYPKYLQLNRFFPSIMTGSTISTSSSTDSIGDLLDIKSILKASHTLSGEVQLEGLLRKMMQLLIENAGAQKGFFIENNDNNLVIQAEGDKDGVTGILQAQPAEESEKLPRSIINYVAHSLKELVFDNVSNDSQYSADDYVQKNQPKSLVCFPILNKGELSAIIYLENNLVEGAFTPARLEILNLLSAQIAISVENTHLYESLEEKVKQRTQALQEAKNQLEINHHELEKSHMQINSSVNYASRIQNAVLPIPETLNKLLPQHFIVYQPRSVVSGDFYWVNQISNKIIVTAVDCTGHGVPGALVSMLGMSFLNEIVPRLDAQSQLNAANILNNLRDKVKATLKQSDKIREQKEGMELALCIIDPANKKLQYAGAYNPLFLIRDNQLIETKGDRMPIGIYRKEKPFTSHDIDYQNEDMIYLASDGYIDQDSEEKDGSFSKKRFRELLVEINKKSMSNQREILISRLEEWKGNLPQRDDILVLGIRLY